MKLFVFPSFSVWRGNQHCINKHKRCNSFRCFCQFYIKQLKITTFNLCVTDLNCTEKPVFTPSRLVVKYGDPTSANCSVCQHCQRNFGLEIPVGDKEINGHLISWKVDHLTEWSLSPLCYYTTAAGHQCCSSLKITLYSKWTCCSWWFYHYFQNEC